MNVITFGLIRSINWAIWSIDTLFRNWYPDGLTVNVDALTDFSLDRLLDIIRLTNHLVRYIEFSNMDQHTLILIINGLVLLLNYLFRFWATSQDVLDAGNIERGHYEAVEVYQDILRNAMQNLRELITNLQGML